MFRMIIAELWPAFIPLIAYALWQWRKRHYARKQSIDIPHFLDGPWMLTLIVAFFVAILCLMLLGASRPPNAGTHYQPKQFIDGTLQQEHLDP